MHLKKSSILLAFTVLSACTNQEATTKEESINNEIQVVQKSTVQDKIKCEEFGKENFKDMYMDDGYIVFEYYYSPKLDTCVLQREEAGPDPGMFVYKLYDMFTKEILLYHATFDKLAKKIEKIGILARGNRIRNFKEVEPGVYLGINPEFAGSMVEASENENIPEDWFDEIVIISVDVSKLDLSKLDVDPNLIQPEDSDVIHSYIYRANIPTNAILEIKDFR